MDRKQFVSVSGNRNTANIKFQFKFTFANRDGVILRK